MVCLLQALRGVCVSVCADLEELWVKVVYFASVCSMPQSSGMHEREACPSEGEVREKI